MAALIHLLPRRARLFPSPDHRFQWLASVPLLIKHGALVSEEDVPDRFIREVLLPFAQLRHGHAIDMHEEDYQGMQGAFEAFNSKAGGGMSGFIAEGYALAGASFDCNYLTNTYQDFYEAAFFDVRHYLDDVQAIVAMVFEPLSREMPRRRLCPWG